MTTLIKTDTKLGEGAEAQAGQTVIVHYTGWLFDKNAPENKGVKFDSSATATSRSISRSAWAM